MKYVKANDLDEAVNEIKKCTSEIKAKYPHLFE